MEYRKKDYKTFNIVDANECWEVNANTGNIKVVTNQRKIDAILNFELATKEEYQNAYIIALKISKNNFKKAITI